MIDVNNLYTVGETVSLHGFSKLIGMTTLKLKMLINEGMPHKVEGSRTFVDTVAATRWIIDYEVRSMMPEDEMTIVEAKRRSEVAKALTSELMLAKERELLANIDDLMLNFTSALIQVRAKLVSQPSRLSGILSHQEQKDIIKILEQDSNDMLETLSEYKHEYIGNEPRSTSEDIKLDKPSLPAMPKTPTKT